MRPKLSVAGNFAKSSTSSYVYPFDPTFISVLLREIYEPHATTRAAGMTCCERSGDFCEDRSHEIAQLLEYRICDGPFRPVQRQVDRLRALQRSDLGRTSLTF